MKIHFQQTNVVSIEFLIMMKNAGRYSIVYSIIDCICVSSLQSVIYIVSVSFETHMWVHSPEKVNVQLRYQNLETPRTSRNSIQSTSTGYTYTLAFINIRILRELSKPYKSVRLAWNQVLSLLYTNSILVLYKYLIYTVQVFPYSNINIYYRRLLFAKVEMLIIQIIVDVYADVYLTCQYTNRYYAESETLTNRRYSLRN